MGEELQEGQLGSVMHRPSPLPVKLCLQLPTFCTPLQHLPARLKNPHAVCYLNASAQALYWLGALTASPRECYGAAQAALKPLMRSGRPYLPSCLPWGPLLRGWHHLSTQHDACEFMVHLLDKAAPAAFEGSWQSRLSDPFTITDEGPLRTPILLDLRGETCYARTQHQQHASALATKQIQKIETAMNYFRC